MAEKEEFEDAASLVDEAFGTAAADDDVTTEPAAEEPDLSELDSEPAGEEPDADEVSTELAAEEPEIGEPAPEEPESGEAATALAAEEPAVGDKVSEPAAEQGPEPSEPKPALATSLKLTRGRLIGAAAVVAGVAAASVLVLSGGGSGNAATPSGAPSTQPSVNPQAFYPLQSASPFETGAKSPLTDAQLQAAVGGCDACKLVTRANGFTPDGGVLALFRTGAPQAGKSNARLVAVGGDGKLLWSAPDGVKALTAGIERFSVDGAGNFYLALPGAKTGQVLVVLAWRDGKVQDLGGLLDPRIKSDSIVGVLPQAQAGAAATATIVSQTTAGVPDADTGGLVESQYQIKDGKPVLIGCRRHVGESGQWLAFPPSADGCTHWPEGPVGPPDDDDDHTAPPS